MLTLRAEQLEVLRQSMWNQCTDAVHSYLVNSYPARIEFLGDEAASEIVERAMQLCELLGATTVGEYCRCVDCILAFGCEFSDDPRLSYFPRQFAALRDSRRETPFADLQKNLAAFRNRTYGDEGVYFEAALTKLCFSLSHHTDVSGLTVRTLSGVSNDLMEFYPELFEELESDAVVSFARRAMDTAKFYNLSDGHYFLYWLRTSFVLGIGFHSDPGLRRIGTALQKSSDRPSKRLRALREAIEECAGLLRHTYGL